MRDDRERLLDILEAIGHIERRLGRASDFGPFGEDELLQVWAVHHLQIIGEAAAHLSETLQNDIPASPGEA